MFVVRGMKFGRCDCAHVLFDTILTFHLLETALKRSLFSLAPDVLYSSSARRTWTCLRSHEKFGIHRSYSWCIFLFCTAHPRRLWHFSAPCWHHKRILYHIRVLKWPDFVLNATVIVNNLVGMLNFPVTAFTARWQPTWTRECNFCALSAYLRLHNTHHRPVHGSIFISPKIQCFFHSLIRTDTTSSFVLCTTTIGTEPHSMFWWLQHAAHRLSPDVPWMPAGELDERCS